jgi:hypothetical protein
MLTPLDLAKIESYRAKSLDNTITLDELKEAVKLMREGRLAASASSDAAKRKKAVAAIPNADDLLGELGI